MVVNAQIKVLIEQLAERVVRKFILDFSQFGSKSSRNCTQVATVLMRSSIPSHRIASPRANQTTNKRNNERRYHNCIRNKSNLLEFLFIEYHRGIACTISALAWGTRVAIKADVLAKTFISNKVSLLLTAADTSDVEIVEDWMNIWSKNPYPKSIYVKSREWKLMKY